MSNGMYLFIPIEDWNEDSPLRLQYPDARVSPDGKEVVVSTNLGNGTHTWEEAVAYITSNWEVEDDLVIDE